MSSAMRRHHDRRVKARWRRRLEARESVGYWTFRWRWKMVRDRRRWCCTIDPDAVQKREVYIARAAVRKAAHPKCPCLLCKGERYQRARERRRWRERPL